MEDSAEGDDDHYESDSTDGDDGPWGGRSANDGQDSNNQDPDSDDDEEEQHFDITLPPTHSYMGSDLEAVRAREVLEAGWRGVVVVVAHHGAVFPGETVPLHLPRASYSQALATAIRDNKMFGLLCPDESGTLASGYGVLCEVFEVGGGGAGGGQAGAGGALSAKARAVYRFRFVDMPKQPLSLHDYSGGRPERVQVLREAGEPAPLRPARLASLDPHRRPGLPAGLQRLEAAATAWPAFVYGMFEFAAMRAALLAHFHAIQMDKIPSEPVALSFWVASNLALAARDRLALLQADSALQRLHMALRAIQKVAAAALCCAACRTALARRRHVFAMSSAGVHSHYTNLGGFMHDVVTVSRAENIALEGGASAEYSWFPGYTWTIARCATCAHHIGWRFDAMKRKLRPQQFFGLCCNQLEPSAGARGDLLALLR